MTNTQDDLTVENKLVLVCDICSSTSILEDLILTDNQDHWRNLLIDLKSFLRKQRANIGFEIYKFIGDGWILLFNIDIPPKILFSFMRSFCDKYESVFKFRIRGVLSTHIENIGITFGLDKGNLINFQMNEQKEYIGRPLNVAARLQAAIKDNDDHPQGKVLMSKPVHNIVKTDISKDYKVNSVERKLRNISGGDRYRAIKLMLYEKP